jgi:PAS domain S-box-containing protein
MPAIIYSLAIAGVMYLAGPQGYLFMLFYLLLLVVSAFLYESLQYLLVVLLSVVGVLASTLYPDLVMEAEYLMGLYMMLTLAVLIRVFANKATNLEIEKAKFAEQIQALEQDKSEIRSLLEALSDGLIVVNENNKITFINPSALNILGVIAPLEKVLGRDVSDYLATIGANGPEPITREVFGKLEPSIRNDFRLVTPEKTLRLHTNISPIVTERANLHGAIILFRDITDEKRNEEQQAEFNAVASHELRTPLSVIEGYLYYVLDPSSKLKYDRETKDYITRAHEAATELNALVTDILTVVKAEEGTLEVNLKKINPIAFLEKLTHEWQDRATAKKLKLKFEVVAHDEIPEIATDPVKVREVLNNLVGNAIKFTEKGSVNVTVGLLKKEMLVTVTDTGPGIAESDKSGIFKKFYRAENWQTRKNGGTGLGLYIAKNLVERLGGRIWMDSELGRGSSFYFTLPIGYQEEGKS